MHSREVAPLSNSGHRLVVSKVQGSRLVVLALAVAVLISSFPYFSSFLPYIPHQDMVFHLYRIEGIAGALSDGQFPVRMQYSQFDGAGYPVSIMYGDLFLYFPAILVLLGLSATRAYSVFVIAINVATVVIAYFSFSRIFRSRRIGVFSAFLWTLSSYRLMDAFVRAAVGEYVALAFLPLIAFAVYAVFSKQPDLRRGYSWLWGAVGLSAVIYSHIISVFLVLVVLLPAIIIGLIYNHEGYVWLRLAIVAALTLALSAAFWVPFLDFYTTERLSINSAQVLAEQQLLEFACAALQPSQLFECFSPMNLSRAEEVDAGIYLYADSMPLSLGVALIGCVVLFLGSRALGSGLCKQSERTVVRVGWLCLAGGAVLCLLTTCIVPFESADPNSLVGHFALLVSRIQFPWRFLGEADLLLLLAGCCALKSVRRNIKDVIALAASALVLLAMLEGGFAGTSFLENSKAYRSMDEIADSWSVGSGEYLPYHDGPAAPPLHPEIKTEGDVIEASLSRKGTTFEVNYSSGAKGGTIALPIFSYAHLAIGGVDQDEVDVATNKEGMLQIAIPPNRNGELIVSFAQPIGWTLAGWCSFLSLVALTVFACWSFRQRRRRAALHKMFT
ncbi:MAG TPA: hypothetical protein OIL80_05745 [Adlercreutzia equolifaciens]|uniref:hypothetical protein n=1 Tax=Adlercreutzia equolifaciens TaxID=446660 RepID=UPI002432D82F|nr:hypothetical protein [Adlercreutzia equolifaciens]HJI12216.1 hypothetical protein [Adlercreutzia equolifaciens]